MSNSTFIGGKFRRGFYQDLPDDWVSDFKIWNYCFFAFRLFVFITVTLQFLWYLRAYKGIPQQSKQSMRYMLATLAITMATGFLFVLKPFLTIVTDGVVYSPVFVELLSISAHFVATFALYPIMFDWLRIIAVFLDGPVSTKVLEKLSFARSKKFRISVFVLSVVFGILVFSTSIVSAVSDDYYFAAMRAQSAIHVIYYAGLSSGVFMFGSGVFSILKMKELSVKVTNNRFFKVTDDADFAIQAAKTLKILKEQVRLILNAAIGAAIASILSLYFAIDFPDFDTSKIGCLVVYSIISSDSVLMILSVQSGLNLQYWIINRVKQQISQSQSRTEQGSNPKVSGSDSNGRDKTTSEKEDLKVVIETPGIETPNSDSSRL